MFGKSNIIDRKDFNQAVHSIRDLMALGKISEEEAQTLLSWILGNYVENQINAMINEEFNLLFSGRN